jgi:hypothetical protein
MATPIAAGAAILARHYLENSSYWGQFCDRSYRSCPSVVRSGYKYVSGALVKAILVSLFLFFPLFLCGSSLPSLFSSPDQTNSGEGMRSTSATSALPARNLTSPPDV